MEIEVHFATWVFTGRVLSVLRVQISHDFLWACAMLNFEVIRAQGMVLQNH